MNRSAIYKTLAAADVALIAPMQFWPAAMNIPAVTTVAFLLLGVAIAGVAKSPAPQQHAEPDRPTRRTRKPAPIQDYCDGCGDITDRTRMRFDELGRYRCDTCRGTIAELEADDVNRCEDCAIKLGLFCRDRKCLACQADQKRRHVDVGDPFPIQRAITALHLTAGSVFPEYEQGWSGDATRVQQWGKREPVRVREPGPGLETQRGFFVDNDDQRDWLRHVTRLYQNGIIDRSTMEAECRHLAVPMPLLEEPPTPIDVEHERTWH